jgi:hypothetical protein
MNNYTLDQHYYLYVFNQLLNFENNNVEISENLKKAVFNIDFDKEFPENNKFCLSTITIINNNIDILNNNNKYFDFIDYDDKTVLNYFFTNQKRYLRKHKLNKIYED